MMNGVSPLLPALLLPLHAGGFGPALLWLVPLLTLVEVAALGFVIYNNLVTLRNDCDRAWGNIDVLLKQRADEIPNLVGICRGYMSHERATLEAVTEARQAARAALGPAEASAAGREMNAALEQLFASAEACPELRADAHFRALQLRITGLESEIADRREYFNHAVTNYNTRIERMPDALVAGWLKCRRRSLLRFAGLDRGAPPAVRRPSAA